MTAQVKGISSYQNVESVMSKVVLHPETEEKIKIKLIGDSITHGVGGTGFTNDAAHGELIFSEGDRSWYVNTKGYCWANSFKEYLESKYHCTVTNLGTTGRSSGHLLNHISEIVNKEDDIVICMIGTNDRNNEPDPYSGEPRSPRQLYQNLQGIYDYVKGLGKDIIFMANIPSSVENESSKAFHMEDVDHVVMKFASDHDMEYISVYKLFLEYCTYTGTQIDSLLADGLHPNDAGYDVMFFLICNALGFGTKRPGATW